MVEVRPGRAETALSVTLVAAAAGAIGVLQLLVLPLWLLPRSALWGWLLVPLTLLTTPFWSTIHEAIHGGLLSDRAWNDRCGRALAVLYGAPFALLKTGHLFHHRYSRTRRERSEIYDPATTGRVAAGCGYFTRLVGGLYLTELASVLLAFAPITLWRRLARRLDSPETVAGLVLERIAARQARQFRTDALTVVAVHAAAFWAYGGHAWMLALAVAGRALLVSFSDNAYHYGTALDLPLEAMNLRLPRALETFALAFNLHSVHHRHPGLRWYQLRAAFEADGDRFHLGWFAAAFRQLRGPIPVTEAAAAAAGLAEMAGGTRRAPNRTLPHAGPR